MQNLNNTNLNNTNTQTTNTNNKGEKLMNNKIKKNREAEVVARREAEVAAAKEARLAAIEPRDIVATMDEVTNHIARCDRDENGNPRGTNGGKYYQEPVNVNGNFVTIAAKDKEGLDKIKEDMEKGLSGDGKFHKVVTINGMKCECVGATEEELEADIAAAEDYAQAHRLGSVFKDIDVAEQLVDAEFNKKDLEQIEVNGQRFLLSYDGNYVMDLEGNTIVDLSNIKSKLSREDVKTLLLEKLPVELENRIPICDGEEEDYYDEDDEDWDDCYDDEDDCDDYDEEEEEDCSPIIIGIRMQ